MFDIVDWDEVGVGNLWVFYVLFLFDLIVIVSGVFWFNVEWLGDSGLYWFVWVDIEIG